MSASTRWLLGIGGIVVVAIVASAVVAFVATGEQEFPEGSPERAVQRYLAAVSERDTNAALSFLSADLQARCGTIPRDAIRHRGERRFRAILEETIEREESVEVSVRMTEFYGDPPFGGGESIWTVVFVLIEEDGEWRFSEAPWPLYCPGRPVTSATSVS